jgi:hypothetical protein
MLELDLELDRDIQRSNDITYRIAMHCAGFRNVASFQIVSVGDRMCYHIQAFVSNSRF